MHQTGKHLTQISKALLYINVKQCESKTIDQSDKQVVMKQS
jgi:hypothetical protein